MNLILPLAITAGVTTLLFVLFLIVRFVYEAIRRLLSSRKEEPLLADNLAEHLEALQPPRNLGDQLDRTFERVVGRSSLELTAGQAAALLLLVAVAAASVVYLWQPNEALAGGAALTALCLQFVFFWVMHRIWQQQAQTQLPDILHLLARSLRAGLTVDQSLTLIAAQGPKPLAVEFKRCAEHMRLGMTVPAALEMTGGRVGLPDFDLLVSLVGLHRATGGNLPLLLDRLASTVRSRNLFRGHVLAVTALSRLTGFCLAMAPPALMLVYWFIYPEYVTRLTQTGQGRAALGVAFLLEVVGVVWLAWLLRID